MLYDITYDCDSNKSANRYCVLIMDDLLLQNGMEEKPFLI